MLQSHIGVSGYRRLPHPAVSSHDPLTASARQSTVRRGAGRHVVRDGRASRRDGQHCSDSAPKSRERRQRGPNKRSELRRDKMRAPAFLLRSSPLSRGVFLWCRWPARRMPGVLAMVSLAGIASCATSGSGDMGASLGGSGSQSTSSLTASSSPTPGRKTTARPTAAARPATPRRPMRPSHRSNRSTPLPSPLSCRSPAC